MRTRTTVIYTRCALGLLYFWLEKYQVTIQLKFSIVYYRCTVYNVHCTPGVLHLIY